MQPDKRVYINGILIDFERNVAHGADGELRIEPKLALLMYVLASDPGAVFSRDDLIDRVWDGAHGADQSLTNSISQLRKILGDTAETSSAIETVPKRGYRLLASVVAVNDGGGQADRPEETVQTDAANGAPQQLLKLVPLFGLGLLLVIVFGAIWLAPSGDITGELEPAPASTLASSDPFEEGDAASIAVLPFANISNDESQTYFSDGISEEILNALANVQGLKVTSRTSAFAFRDAEGLRIPEIAQLLGVRYILEGSVRRSGSTVRVTAQLIDAETDEHVWSRTFDDELTADNIFDIQDAIAWAIVDQLGLIDDPAAIGVQRWVDVKTGDLNAYQAFLQGRGSFTSTRSTESTREGIEFFERATELDPDFALAWAHLAGAYQVAPSWLLVDRAYHALAKQAANRALQLDPDLALPFGVLGLGEIESHPADYSAAFAYFDQASKKQPENTSILIWRGIAHVSTGFFEKGAEDLQTCIEVDPGNDGCRTWLALAKLFDEQPDTAFELFEQSAANGSRTHLGIFAKAYAVRSDERAALLTWAWDYEGASIQTDRFYRAHTDPQFDFDLEARLYEAEHQTEYGSKPNWGKAGSIDAAHTFKKYDTLEPYWWYPVWWLRMHEDFLTSPYRKRLIREHGVLDYWRETGFPPQCRPIGEDDFECD